MPRQVGTVIAELKRLEYYDKTMIWFTTDNGPEVNCSPEGRCVSSSIALPRAYHYISSAFPRPFTAFPRPFHCFPSPFHRLPSPFHRLSPALQCPQVRVWIDRQDPTRHAPPAGQH